MVTKIIIYGNVRRNTLWHMVRDGKLPATEFLELVREKIVFENSPKLVQSVIG